MAQHFNLAAFQAFVDRALGACTHQALDLHAKLIAQAFGHVEHLGTVWVAHDLHIAFAVAQVNKNHTTVVTPAVNPAAQRNGFAQLGFGHLTAIVRTHGHSYLSRRRLVGS